MNLTRKIRALFTLAAVTAAVTCLAACNTMEGVGEDVEGAGQAIEDAAD